MLNDGVLYVGQVCRIFEMVVLCVLSKRSESKTFFILIENNLTLRYLPLNRYYSTHRRQCLFVNVKAKKTPMGASKSSYFVNGCYSNHRHLELDLACQC